MASRGAPQAVVVANDSTFLNKATEFIEKLLSALEANYKSQCLRQDEEATEAEAHENGQHCLRKIDDLFPEETSEIAIAMSKLRSEIKRMNTISKRPFWFIIAGLCDVLFQLRAWYSPCLGDLLLQMLDDMLKEPLPRGNLAPQVPEEATPSAVVLDRANTPGSAGGRHPWSNLHASLAALRVLEGVVLICTAVHKPQETAGQLEKLIRARVLPLGTAVRLEATFASLQLQDHKTASTSPSANIPPSRPLNFDEGEQFLLNLVSELVPSDEATARVAAAQNALQVAVPKALPGWRPEFFGSSINGFNIKASDVDCVVLPEDEDVLLLLEAECAENSNKEQPSPTSQPSPSKSAKPTMKAMCAEMAKKFAAALRAEPELGFQVEEVIDEARVPIVKCKWVQGDADVAVDISFNNTLPLHNSRLLRAYADLNPKVASLGRLVKHWAKQRGVNDSLQGTLSSYSYTLLVIHYLQHVKLLPNLQDKSLSSEEVRALYGQMELVDGRHDVWFMDPSRLGPDLTELEGWRENAPKDVTLRGLLGGFFRYWAYEFPFYANVASIHREPHVVPKLLFFEEFANSQQMHDDAAPEDEYLEPGEPPPAEEEAEASPSVHPHPKEDEEVDSLPALDVDVGAETAGQPIISNGLTRVTEGGEDHMEDSEGDDEEEVKLHAGVIGELADDQEEVASTVAPSSSALSTSLTNKYIQDSIRAVSSVSRTVSEQDEVSTLADMASSPQKKFKLPRAAHVAQQRLASKQLLCIEDPMESGRLLGTSFNGMERIVHEWRQACYLLHAGGDARLARIFQGLQGPPKNVRNLRDDQFYPGMFSRTGRGTGTSSGSSTGYQRPVRSDTVKISKSISIPDWGVAKLLENGGQAIKEMQKQDGVLRVHVDRVSNSLDASDRRQGKKVNIDATDMTVISRCQQMILDLVNGGGRSGTDRYEYDAEPIGRGSSSYYPATGKSGYGKSGSSSKGSPPSQASQEDWPGLPSGKTSNKIPTGLSSSQSTWSSSYPPSRSSARQEWPYPDEEPRRWYSGSQDKWSSGGKGSSRDDAYDSYYSTGSKSSSKGGGKWVTYDDDRDEHRKGGKASSKGGKWLADDDSYYDRDERGGKSSSKSWGSSASHSSKWPESDSWSKGSSRVWGQTQSDDRAEWGKARPSGKGGKIGEASAGGKNSAGKSSESRYPGSGGKSKDSWSSGSGKGKSKAGW